jgi:membrane protein
MNIVDHIKDSIVGLLTAPREELTGWKKFGQTQMRWWLFSTRQLHKNNALAMSAALSFRTIFAMVPTIVLAFLMLKALGFVDEQKQLLQDFLRESGLSSISYQASDNETTIEGQRAFVAVDEGDAVEGKDAADGEDASADSEAITLDRKIEEFIDQLEGQLTVGAMGPIGVALLVWAAITLLTTIERSMNRVFEAPRNRPLGRRLVLYWASLTLAPMLMIMASVAANRAGQAVSGVPILGQLVESAGWLAAIVVGIVVLAAIYHLMPNTRVPFKTAIAGAAVAVPLWLVARWAFALYVRRVAGGSVYGAMGLLPLFLLWLNASWWIFLFGAQLAHTAGNLDRLAYAENVEGTPIGPWDILAALVAVVRINAARHGPVPTKTVVKDLACSPARVNDLLDRLVAAGLICRVANATGRQFVPAVSADQLKVADILSADCPYADDRQWPGDKQTARAVHEALGKSQAAIETLSIADLIHP